MTSDAKIGLLLGLVFIFVIAFVINGLPSFRNATNNSELTTNMVSSPHENQPIGTNERKVQEGFDWTGQLIEEPVTEAIPSPPVEEKKQDIRFEMPIPENITVAKETSIEITPELVEKTLALSNDPAVQEPDAARMVDAEYTETFTIEPLPAEKEPEPKKPRPSRPAVPQIYVVSKGDTLGAIAKKVYGSEEGNRIANVARIFEANRKILKSMDVIDVGQKIIVPPLRASKSNKGRTDSTLANSFFEEVIQIGERLLSSDKPRAKRGKQYVVQDGDNLWQVATKSLGDPVRYKEIVKLNPAVLKDEYTKLLPGMNLNLPAQ
jgi:nucleoid-associated protein YgaU